MGGAAAGDLASAVAIDTIRADRRPPATARRCSRCWPARSTGPTTGSPIWSRPTTRLDGMGTTVTGALFDGGRARAGPHRRQPGLPAARRPAGAADPRPQLGAVAGRRGQDQRGRGRRPPAPVAAAQGAQRPAGQRAGPRPWCTVQAGDRLLFCSDGLCGLVDDHDDRGSRWLSPTSTIALAPAGRRALAEGGIDNITVILADVVEAEAGTTDATPSLGCRGRAGRPPPAGRARRRRPRTPSSTGATGRRGVSGLPAATAAGGRPRTRPATTREPPQPAAAASVRWSACSSLLLVVGGRARRRRTPGPARQYFVGAAGDQVAIYQGLSERLPGIQLSQRLRGPAADGRASCRRTTRTRSAPASTSPASTSARANGRPSCSRRGPAGAPATPPGAARAVEPPTVDHPPGQPSSPAERHTAKPERPPSRHQADAEPARAPPSAEHELLIMPMRASDDRRSRASGAGSNWS